MSMRHPALLTGAAEPEILHQGLLAAFIRKATTRPQSVFARHNGEAITFGDLHRRSDALAAELGRCGHGPGSRVAVMMANSPATIAVILGLAKAGAIWVPVNVQQRGPGLQFILEHAAPAVTVVDIALERTLRDARAGLDGTVIVHHGTQPCELEQILDSGAPFETRPASRGDEFAIMYTSGTTGRPKGVIVTHAMLALSGEGVMRVSDAADGDVFFVWEPLYHIGGAQLLALPILLDVELALVERFSASRFWQQVIEARATHIHYLGGILQILLKQPPSPLERQHRVRVAWGGGCPADVWRAVESRFGVRVRECYGMTEASSITTFTDGPTPGKVGTPVPWFSVEVVDADGRPLPPGVRGEIVLRTSIPDAIFPGYFKNEAATAAALIDGVLHTGDYGSIDETGALTYHGRKNDSVRHRGENVSAWEVEHVAASHPAVEDAAMIGVPGELGDQDIKLFAQLNPDARLEARELSDWLGERLAPYQNPRFISFVSEFRRTPSQRIIKHALPKDLNECWDRLAAAGVATRRRGNLEG